MLPERIGVESMQVPTAPPERVGMPEVSRFFGIVIRMFYNDHAPPHFHVQYGNDYAAMTVETGELQFGQLSPRVLSLVREWATLHKAELMGDWELARAHAPACWPCSACRSARRMPGGRYRSWGCRTSPSGQARVR